MSGKAPKRDLGLWSRQKAYGKSGLSCSCHVILIEVGEVGKTEFLFRFGLGGLLCGSYFSLFIIKHIKILEEKFAGSMGKGKKEPSTAVMDVVLHFTVL